MDMCLIVKEEWCPCTVVETVWFRMLVLLVQNNRDSYRFRAFLSLISAFNFFSSPLTQKLITLISIFENQSHMTTDLLDYSNIRHKSNFILT